MSAPALATVEDHRAKVRLEQIRSVYEQSPTTTIGSLVVGLVLLVLMWGQVSRVVLLGWSLALCIHQAIRVWQFLGYRRASAVERGSPRWGRMYTFSAISAGCIWGSAGILMFVPGSLQHQAVLLLVLSGIAAVAVAGLSAYAPALYFVPSLTLAPFLLRLMMTGAPGHLIFAIPGLLVLVISLLFGRQLHQLIADSLTKRFENLELIDRLRAQAVELTAQTSAAEMARQEAQQANHRRSEFFRAANHDLRQPLHALGIFGQAVREQVEREQSCSPKLRLTVDHLNDSIRDLENLMNALLDISRLEEGRIVPELCNFPINPLLETLRRDFSPEAAAKGVDLRIVHSRAIVFSDPVLLERILGNLVANAVRYTERGGILIGCRGDKGQIRIEVHDTGIGIPESEQERIFDEFYQVGGQARHSRKGMGLGLATVRRLSDLLGHRVEVFSVVNRGSRFRIIVPRGRAESGPMEHPAEPASAPGSVASKVVVVVDDEPAILTAMNTLLSSWGCIVLAESSLSGALEGLGRLPRYPDLIIADYRLQGDENGLMTIDRIREELGVRIPAIVITASVSPELAQAVRQRGDQLVRKPLLPDELRRAVNQLVGAHP